MDQETAPIDVKALTLKHDFKSLKREKKRAYDDLKKLDLAMQEVPLKILTFLKYQEAFDTLQNTKLKTSFKELIKNEHAPRIEDLKFYNSLTAIKKVSHPRYKLKMTQQALCKLHKLVQKNLKLPKDLGKYRDRQNWIGPEGCSEKEAYFFPPFAKDVKKHMRALFEYLEKSKDDPVTKLALFFAQFLIIHPFMDGNGRVARLLVSPFLKEAGICDTGIFCMSGYFKKHRLKYFETLYEITSSGNWTPWMKFFYKGLSEAAKNQLKVVTELKKSV